MRWTVLCVLNLLAVQAMAFDFEEHKYVSNVALRIVLADAAVGKKLAAAAKDLAEATAADEHRSFDDIAALADYIPDPNPGETSTEFEDYRWSFGYEPGQRDIPKRDRTNAARIAFRAYDAYIPDWPFFAPREILLLGYENSSRSWRHE